MQYNPVQYSSKGTRGAWQEAVSVNGDPIDLLEYAGWVSLVVNAAPNTWDSKQELARLQMVKPLTPALSLNPGL